MQETEQTDIPAIGSQVDTPRFGRVRITAVFTSSDDAQNVGFKEPTHLYDRPYDVWGKRIALNNSLSDWLFAVIVRRKWREE